MQTILILRQSSLYGIQEDQERELRALNDRKNLGFCFQTNCMSIAGRQEIWTILGRANYVVHMFTASQAGQSEDFRYQVISHSKPVPSVSFLVFGQ